MVGGEGGGMAGFGDYNGRGGGQVPSDRLCGPEEVPPAGVVFNAERHPGHRDGVSSSRGRSAQRIYPSLL